MIQLDGSHICSNGLGWFNHQLEEYHAQHSKTMKATKGGPVGRRKRLSFFGFWPIFRDENGVFFFRESRHT